MEDAPESLHLPSGRSPHFTNSPDVIDDEVSDALGLGFELRIPDGHSLKFSTGHNGTDSDA